MILRFDAYEVDLAQQELRRGGTVVPVEPQVFDVLAYLVQNHGRIISKDELLEAVWQGRIVSDAALTSRISSARRAIGDDGATQTYIRTVHKRGLRFVGDVQADEAAAPGDGEMKESSPRQILSQDTPTLAPAVAPAEPLPLPNKPSIAVLPFQNMSGDPEQEYFADGLTEDIITGLSQQQWFFVIARNSSFTYKGEAGDVRQIAGQLGVRYILEGSVRKSASRVRVTGQLIDATLGNHLWAERYDRELSDIFELQDEITTRVVGSVSPQILLAEAARVKRKTPQSIEAWDLVMQALPYMWRMTTEDHGRAQDLLLEALTLDPEYAHAYALLGWTYVTMFNLDTGKPIHEFTERALDAGTRAVELDDQDPWGTSGAGPRACAAAPAEARADAPVKGDRAQSEFRAGPCRARLWAGGRRTSGTRARGAGAGASAEPARSVPCDLRADRSLHGALCARALRGGHPRVPLDDYAAPEACGRLAAADCFAGPARQGR